MNKVTKKEVRYSSIKIPKFNGLGTAKLNYKHEVDKVSNESLNLSITVSLEIHEIGGSKIFKIMSGTSKFNIEIIDKLTVSDLSKIWIESAKNVTRKFKKFQFQKKIKPIIDVKSGGEEELNFDSLLSDLVIWFYSIPSIKIYRLTILKKEILKFPKSYESYTFKI